MVRVLQVSATLSSLDGGPAEAALNLNRALRAHGVDATIVSTDQHSAGQLPDERRRYITASGVAAELYRAHWPFGVKASIRMALALSRHVRASDVVHIHGFYLWHAVLAATYAQFHRVPYLIQPHGVFEPYQEQQSTRIKSLFMRLGGRRALRLASAIAFDTETERRVAVLPRCARAVRRVIIAPAPRGQRPKARDIGGVSPGPHILFLARIAPKKRVDLVIAAMPEILRQFPGARLTIAGDDAEHLAESALQQSPAQARAAITCCGFVEGVAKDELIDSADVYVLPSENENFGISVTEALAAGLPVVISKNIALWQQVREHEAGIVIDQLDAADVAQAVCTLFSDAQRLHTAGNAALDLGRILFSADATREQAMNAYETALGMTPALH
ncbi:glycosyltransferase [Kineosporia succinea]|nr:glycosyltransferase [Kineosporia succinea]